ncbi:hypothetical protein [Allomesorhizobium camelthorni]|uniref:Uncharacterized protein n=1 Tax=Allomesorhizobium camelthorni TaxID=475069 RepID=A0A6G4WF59_9HYPH|nr:hypothetical protein [Mesorhizobium camelthorni]NGO53445.1 hypothetical protein [Mesorhizobium camelthorni]
MLQINTGKLYARGVGRTNQLRGVLYSNLELCYGYDVATAAGTLRETDGMRGNRAIVYEIEERIEQAEVGPGFLISHTIGPFLIDFAALATFGLRAIVSPDPAVVDRLTSKAPGLASYDPPSKFIRRYFDERIALQEGEIARFKELVDQLLALDRRHFLGAMRAIRTFVTALHRMRDDLALAYTLLVSAVESLAQEFDGYTTSWKDVDERKRVPVDRALAKASKRTGNAVREAILGSEHASLARRYRAFVLHHVDRDYFRAPDLIAGAAIARHELGEALRQAYVLRSRYVHNVRQLPDAITLSDGDREAAEVDRRPVLSFQGLVRLTHHVITAFIANGPTTTHEPYNYTREQAGVVMVPLAPEMWVGMPLMSAKQARQRLEGHLEQLVPVLMNAPNATVTDLRPIFPDMERLAKSCAKLERSQLLTLYALFARLIPKHDHSAKLDALIEQHMDVIGAPSSEALVARTIFGMLEAWSIDVHREALEQYIAARVTPSGLQAPRILEAAMCLALAERFRVARRYKEAREWVGFAVEACPGHQAVRDLEERFSYRKRVDWQNALMPRLALRRAPKHKPSPSAISDSSAEL